MRKYPAITVVILLLLTGFSKPKPADLASPLAGAWRKTSGNETTVLILSDDYFAFGTYDLGGKRFIGAGGGTYRTNGNTFTENIEFYTLDSTRVGSTNSLTSTLRNNTWRISGTRNGKKVDETWERIDQPSQSTPLAQAWRIRERQTNEGTMSTMQRGARKTIKILSGTRFQWAAINTETKQFFGTGGGTYTAKDGKYTENIEFFSRDSSRVGASLTFDFEVKNGDWHHRGKSSTGNPIYEIWEKE
jgi:hypothetical protein